MIRAVSILLILWGCAFAQAPINIVSSTPLGMPCGGTQTLGCMPDKDCGWMVVVRTGDAAAFSGKLTYTDIEGKEQTATATASATGEYTALAFRVGVFRPGTGNRFVSVEITSLKVSATVRQDAEGTVITVGDTTWGPPKQASTANSPVSAATIVPLRSSFPTIRRSAEWLPGDTLFKALRWHAALVVAVKVKKGGLQIEQPPLELHSAPVRLPGDLYWRVRNATVIPYSDTSIIGPAPETLSDLAVRLAGESLRVTPRISGLTTIVTKGDPAQAATNLKEYK